MIPWKSLSTRLASVFVASAIPNVAVGAVVGVEVWRSTIMSGSIAVLAVIKKLADGLRDGDLSSDDIETAFEAQD